MNKAPGVGGHSHQSAPSTRTHTEHFQRKKSINPDAKRNYQVFPGRNLFFCRGRLILSHQYGIFCLTLFLVCATNVLFFVFDCPYLVVNGSLAIPIVGALLFAFVLGSLFRTAFSDPGILPRSLPDEASYWETRLSYFIADSTTNPSDAVANRVVARYLDVQVKDHVLKLKWCHTCRLFRPPRSSHCSVCDNCVDHFDHHCPWVGNCVGRRNYRFFYSFVVVLSILALYILACNIAHLVIRSQSVGFVEAIKQTPATLIEAIVCFLSLWSLLGLMGYHTYLVSKNMTTNEDIKGGMASGDGSHPSKLYARGKVYQNFFDVLCSPIPPSLLDASGKLDPAVLAVLRQNAARQSLHPNAVAVPPVPQNFPPNSYPRQHYQPRDGSQQMQHVIQVQQQAPASPVPSTPQVA